MLTFTQLRTKLQISQPKLTSWIQEGLPWEGTERKKRFDPEQVSQWLIETGKAARPPAKTDRDVGRICTTRAEAAQELGVAPRTLATWCTYDDFPGRPGHRGRREGFYPITEIRQWRERTFGESEPESQATSARARKDNAQAEMAELDLAERRGELIPLQVVINFYARQMAQAKAQLMDLADIVASLLPPKLNREEKKRIRDRVDEVRDQVLQTFVELLEGDQDSTEDEE